MKTINLTRGAEALVDDDDFEFLSKFKWSLDGHGYAVRCILKGGKKTIKMHREIMMVTGNQSLEVDHIDGNPLNNQKYNLRICSHAQNMMNMKMHRDNKVGLKGVSLCKATGRFKAQICFDGVNKNLGRYDTPEEAHEVYCAAAEKLHKEFARTK